MLNNNNEHTSLLSRSHSTLAVRDNTDFKADWFEFSRTMGIGDGIWMACSFLIGDSDPLVTLSNFWLPLVIGPIMTAISYRLQCFHFKRIQQQVSTDNKKQIMSDSISLGLELTMGMFGWECFVLSAKELFHSFEKNPFLFHGTLGTAAGIGQLMAVISTNLILKKHKFGDIRTTKYDIIKASVACFISGASWYAISQLDFDHNLHGFASRAFNATIGFILTATLVTTIFSVTKPKASWASLKKSWPQWQTIFCSRKAQPTPTRSMSLQLI